MLFDTFFYILIFFIKNNTIFTSLDIDLAQVVEILRDGRQWPV